MRKDKTSPETLKKLLDEVYKNITVEVDPRREEFSFEGEYEEMSQRRSEFLTEYLFFKNKGDNSPERMIWCIKKGDLPYEIMALEEPTGKYRIKDFEVLYSFGPEKQSYKLSYS